MNISSDDAKYFLYMIGSSRRSNLKKELGKRNPYYSFLKNRESEEYKRFIKIYEVIKNILSEKERQILDQHYGINRESVPLGIIGNEFNIGGERVRQIKVRAEFHLAKEITSWVNL